MHEIRVLDWRVRWVWRISFFSSSTFQSESCFSQFYTSVCLDPLRWAWCETESSFGLWKQKRKKMDVAAETSFLPLLLWAAGRINSQWTSDGWEAVSWKSAMLLLDATADVAAANKSRSNNALCQPSLVSLQRSVVILGAGWTNPSHRICPFSLKGGNWTETKANSFLRSFG